MSAETIAPQDAGENTRPQFEQRRGVSTSSLFEGQTGCLDRIG